MIYENALRISRGVFNLSVVLSGESDEYAERQVLAEAVAEDEFSEVERLVGVLETEVLFYDCLSQYCGVAV